MERGFSVRRARVSDWHSNYPLFLSFFLCVPLRRAWMRLLRLSLYRHGTNTPSTRSMTFQNGGGGGWSARVCVGVMEHTAGHYCICCCCLCSPIGQQHLHPLVPSQPIREIKRRTCLARGGTHRNHLFFPPPTISFIR